MIDEKDALVFTFIDPDKPYRQVNMFLEEDKSYKKLSNHMNRVPIGSLDISELQSIPDSNEKNG